MANIALLVPNDELFRLTHDVLQEQQKRLFLMKVIESERAVMEARQAINQGAEIIIARGLQATIIKQYTDIPVVEIVLTRQGVMDMLERAMRIVHKSDPHIAIVTFKNMACDMTGLGEQCGVHLHEYFVQNPELLRPAALQAIEDKADLIIGGQTVLTVADDAGVPSLFITNTEDAVEAAVQEAFRLAATFDGTGGLPENAYRRTEAVKASSFVNFPYTSARMQAAVTLAEKLSETDCPKLLIEPVGRLYRAFANAIHNKSKHSKEKLVVYDCVAGESAYEELFGRLGKMNDAAKGTLQINFIEDLDRRSQKKLLEILMFRNVIAVSKKADLRPYLIPELYERLTAFAIRIPSLMETPEDIPFLADIYLRRLAEQYGRYHVLTKEGMKTIAALPWHGGRIQLESFLERLVITIDHRSLRPEDITGLYTEIYGAAQRMSMDVAAARTSIQQEVHASARTQHAAAQGEPWTAEQSPAASTGSFAAGRPSARSTPALTVQEMERDRIVTVLAECMGSREKAAAKLGISKTTLWRKLRQYGILD